MRDGAPLTVRLRRHGVLQHGDAGPHRRRVGQTYRTEYLVVDGSTDSTLDILKGYGDRLSLSSPTQHVRREQGSHARCGGSISSIPTWYATPDALAKSHLDPERTTYFGLVRAIPR
jgi:hypothetical protein